jgi:S1-C subfamily serine protease
VDLFFLERGTYAQCHNSLHAVFANGYWIWLFRRETDDSGGFLAKTGAVPSRGSPDFVTLAKKLQPIVVNVSTTQIAPGPSPRGQPDPEEDPMNELLERFFGQRPSPAYFSDELSFYAL